MQLLLLHYNNYFNRIIKKENTIADYKAADADYKEVSNINFNPGDGVNTALVLGLGQNGSLFEGADFDYLVDEDIICKIVVKLPPFMSAFEVGTSSFNPRSLTENHYLTFGHNTLTALKNYPFVTLRASAE